MVTRKSAIIFALINFIMLSLFIDRQPNHQGLSRTLPVVTIIEKQSLCIDRYHELTNDKCYVQQHYYSDKAPLPTLLIVPGYALLNSLGFVTADPVNNSLYNSPLLEITGAVTIGIIPSLILLIILLYHIANTYKIQVDKAAAIVMGLFYGSFLFLQSGTLFAHLIASLFIVSALILYQHDRFFLTGLLAGLAILSEYTIGFFLLVILMLHIQNKRKSRELLYIGYGSLPALFFQLFYNYSITGSFIEMPYQNVMADYSQMKHYFGFSWPTWEAFIGLTVSPYRGLLFYAPATIIFLLLYLFDIPKNRVTSSIFNAYLIIPILYIILISGYFSWWGGWCYGPRHLTSAYLILALGAIPFFRDNKYLFPLFRILSLMGLILGLMALNTYWQGLATHYTNPFSQRIIPALIVLFKDTMSEIAYKNLIKSTIILFLFLGTPLIISKVSKTKPVKS